MVAWHWDWERELAVQHWRCLRCSLRLSEEMQALYLVYTMGICPQCRGSMVRVFNCSGYALYAAPSELP